MVSPCESFQIVADALIKSDNLPNLDAGTRLARFPAVPSVKIIPGQWCVFTAPQELHHMSNNGLFSKVIHNHKYFQ